MGIYQLAPESELKNFLSDKISYYKQHVYGECASYIPELKKADPTHLSIALLLPDGTSYTAGDCTPSFTFQSISKVISFIAACMHHETENVLDWVDVEPTGDSFNSILRFELKDQTKPYNPMINAGALTVASLLPGEGYEAKVSSVTDLLSDLLDKEVGINEKVFSSEWETAYRNRALANFLMENQLLASGVEETLLAYIKLCSIEINALDLAKIGLILSQDGYDPIKKQQLIPTSIARLAKVLMFTCGMYNSSGKFAAFVGIPAKSGVSGGIMASIPPSSRNTNILSEGCGVGVYGPAIDANGNSVMGVRLLQDLVELYDLKIF
ncbi:MAG TPA: glutaminase A [Bacillaceae bacterium]